jgi:endonuclease III
MSKIKLNKKYISVFTTLQNNNPSPTTELIFSSNFELLIAVLLSAQSTDIAVNKATTQLFAIANTPQQILDLGLDELISYIKSIGLYKTKSKHIIQTCKDLIEKHAGIVPNCQKSLEKLAGVGRKTANVVRNTAFAEPIIAVDTHIFRVAKRIGLAKKNSLTPLAVELDLIKNTPEEFKLNAHHWLILHGRYICKARKPSCELCILKQNCDYYAAAPC